MCSEVSGALEMASKKKQLQKKKLRSLKKKKAEAKILEGRAADAEKKGTERGAARPEFNARNLGGRKGAASAPKMHRPQGG